MTLSIYCLSPVVVPVPSSHPSVFLSKYSLSSVVHITEWPQCGYILGWSSFPQGNQNPLKKKMETAGRQIKYLPPSYLKVQQHRHIFLSLNNLGMVVPLPATEPFSGWSGYPCPKSRDLWQEQWVKQQENNLCWWCHSWGQQAFKWGERGIMCRSMGKEPTARKIMELDNEWSILQRTTPTVSSSVALDDMTLCHALLDCRSVNFIQDQGNTGKCIYISF